MSDKERVQDFQRKLYLKAKQEKKFRFYVYTKSETEKARERVNSIAKEHIKYSWKNIILLIHGITQD